MTREENRALGRRVRARSKELRAVAREFRGEAKERVAASRNLRWTCVLERAVSRRRGGRP